VYACPGIRGHYLIKGFKDREERKHPYNNVDKFRSRDLKNK
jgi:hypothetical protein